jgi:hypothetical protein
MKNLMEIRKKSGLKITGFLSYMSEKRIELIY